MLLGIIFWTETENFGKIKNYLKKSHGLVPPISEISGSTPQGYIETHLVYEDPSLVFGKLKGVYRVNFQFKHPDGSHIGFALL